MPSITGSATQSLPTILGVSSPMGAAEQGSAPAPATASSDYVNYVDVKLEGVHHLPSDWLNAGLTSSSAGGGGGTQAAAPANAAHLPGKEDEVVEVAYAYHPFRYEVTLSLPADPTSPGEAATVAGDTTQGHTLEGDGSASMAVSFHSPSVHEVAAADIPSPPTSAPVSTVVAAFTRGRVLQPLPIFTAYIANAEAPPVNGLDDAAPLRDVPAAIDAEDVRRAEDSMREDREERQRDASSPTSPSGARQHQQPPSILWVVTDKTDGAGANNTSFIAGSGSRTSSATAGTSSGLLAAKRRAKSSGGIGGGGSSTASASGRGAAPSLAAAAAVNNAAAQAAAAAAAVPGAPPPPLPEVSEPAPCVVRVPLTAAQEAHLEALLSSGKPLELSFRRTLRAGCPADWEDLNASYYEAVIPVSLQALSVPGSTQLSAEVPLQPAYTYYSDGASFVAGGAAGGMTVLLEGGAAAGAAGDHHDKNNRKRTVNRKTRQTVPGLLVDEPDLSVPHPYTSAGTSAAVTLTFQRTLTRLVSDRIRPAVTPAQLIPSRPTPTLAAAAAADVRVRLQRTLESIAQQLLRDVREVAIGTSLAKERDSAKGSVDSAAWRAQFVALLQSTGQLAAFKSRLTPLVTELVQERLRVQPTASLEEVARASNDLYVQLMDMLHETLRDCMEAGGSANGDAADSAAAEEEARDSELRWRALEAEVSGEVSLAGTLYHSRLATHSGDAASWAALWVGCGLHYQRVEELAKAEQCYREAIACDVTCVPALLDYGVWLLANDRLDEAAVFLHGVVDVAPRHALGWGCVALLADLRELAVRVGSPGAATEQSKWRREHNLALRRAVECLEQEERGGESASSVNASAEEQLYITVAAYLVQLHHRDLANVCLARCHPGEPRVELLYAQLFTQGGQYDEALKALSAIKENTPSAAEVNTEAEVAADTCVLLHAECVFAQGHIAEAVALYKQALAKGSPATAPAYLPQLAARWRNDSAARRTTNATNSSELVEARRVEATCVQRLAAYLCLCNALLAEGRYKDALGAVTVALQVWPSCSVLWLGAGIAYYRAGYLIAAEECLQESNTLNPSNARTWVYLTLLSVRLQHTGLEELIQQVMGLNMDDASLWAELGRTLLNTALYPKLSIVCLRRAAALARAQLANKNSTSSAAAALLPSTLYHLAHALMDAQQWEEAERLLGEVAAEGGGNEVLRGKAEEELALLHAA
ncbi:hypothetical protein ABL78_1329 [Leptomonas seymouri]|uniref:Uncharacterized protein n=1 Tax=Leptomonas seymouri TaxID=5684 RepID=A0A0N1I2E1_LEPSE|nr:hypothetical protein ABL78_1329 [Leptomonas seymouri]|eukprot:KPI89561.1 hypothetical protein ABL78_1329 [Leptomonas seymouri]